MCSAIADPKFQVFYSVLASNLSHFCVAVAYFVNSAVFYLHKIYHKTMEFCIPPVVYFLELYLFHYLAMSVYFVLI